MIQKNPPLDKQAPGLAATRPGLAPPIYQPRKGMTIKKTNQILKD